MKKRCRVAWRKVEKVSTERRMKEKVSLQRERCSEERGRDRSLQSEWLEERDRDRSLQSERCSEGKRRGFGPLP